MWAGFWHGVTKYAHPADSSWFLRHHGPFGDELFYFGLGIAVLSQDFDRVLPRKGAPRVSSAGVAEQ